MGNPWIAKFFNLTEYNFILHLIFFFFLREGLFYFILFYSVLFYFLIYFPNQFFFLLFSMVTQLYIHVHILLSHIIMLHHKRLDTVPSATQIPKAIVCIHQSQAPNIPHSLLLPLGNHKSVLHVHEFPYCRKVHLCHVLDSRKRWYHMVFVFLFLTYFTQDENL